MDYSKKIAVLLTKHIFFIGIYLWFGILLLPSCRKSTPQQPEVLSSGAITALDKAEVMIGYGHGMEALTYLDSAYKTFEPNTKDLFEKYRYNFQYYLVKRNDMATAGSYLDSLFFMIKERKEIYKKEYVTALFLRGNLELKRRQYEHAFKCYYDARTFAMENLNICDAYAITNKIGLIRYQEKQYQKAIIDIKQALVESKSCKGSNINDLSKHGYFNTIGLCFEKLNQLDSAVTYYKMSLAFIDQNAARFPKDSIFIGSARGVVYGNLGGTYAKQGAYKLSEKYLKKSIMLNDRPRFEQIDAQTAKLKLWDLYLSVADFKKADLMFKDLWSTFLHPPSERQMPIDYRLKMFQLRWKYFDQQNMGVEAYRWRKKYNHLKDSLDNIAQINHDANLDQIFKLNDKDNELLLLAKDNSLKRTYIIAFIFCLLIGACTLFVVWQNWKNSKKLNLKITRQNFNMTKALEALQQSQEENTRIVKIVAHDLRNPMAITISIANIMLQNDHLLDADKEMLELLKTSSNHSLDMIADLLSMNVDKTDLKKDEVELHELLNYCVGLLNFKAAEKEQRIVLRTQNVTLFISREKIWRVISNLIVNAIKFSDKGTVINVDMVREPKSVLITIKDNGIGIPDELKDKVFNMFSDARRLGTSGEVSFGLGLTICKQIIEAHDGEIWFESELNKGTTFFIRLPFSTAFDKAN
ncbi:HAMP domain-containing sensor histidine kinase [Pedobacter sp. Hv1]|uniref:tetratricopeptide repeat-containing sensor histidine kinase n=1 Tax=Pedobacter sp. Hv1 TaxID=1740090 RepID=UPI0006D8BD9F|nr:HAMP domain-containing sensor histidine kinase [Pedobacter sp. Hv1]KQC01454.1 hypothetical protein AQF98_07035 [Pedobacter sp. Hv1]